MEIIKERVKVIIEEDNKYFRGCDLCDDKESYPLLSWACYHDDSAHSTQVCPSCLKEVLSQW